MDEVDSIAVAREGGSARSGAGHGGNSGSGHLLLSLTKTQKDVKENVLTNKAELMVVADTIASAAAQVSRFHEGCQDRPWLPCRIVVQDHL